MDQCRGGLFLNYGLKYSKGCVTKNDISSNVIAGDSTDGGRDRKAHKIVKQLYNR